jgi:hypothetical protein
MMANALYGKGRNGFARGEIAWKSGGNTIKAVLVDTDVYTVQIDTHEFLSDVAVGARLSTGTLTLLDPALGVCDAEDTTLSGPISTTGEAIVIYKDTGNDATSPLIAYIDTVSAGLPVPAFSGDVLIQWDNDANKIFKL